MRLSWRRRLSVYAGLGTFAIALLSVASAAPASAQTKSMTFTNVNCKAIVNGSPMTTQQDITVAFSGPDQVAPNASFTVTIPGGSAALPDSAQGLQITQYSDLTETYQIKGTKFTAGTIVNPGNASLAPEGGGATIPLTETAALVAVDKLGVGTPGPMPPGVLTTPDVSVNAVAPASGAVTLNAFQLTTTVVLNGVLTAQATCAVPTTTVMTIPVVAGTTTSTSTTPTTSGPTTSSSSTTPTTGGPTTSTSSTTPTTTGPTTSTSSTTPTTTGPTTSTSSTTPTTTGPTTSTTPTTEGTTVPITTGTTLPNQTTIHESGANTNTCNSTLVPPLQPPSKTSVGITIATDATPSPHLGDPITLSNSTVTVAVPGSLLVEGYNLGILVNGQKIPSTLDLTVTGANTVEGTRAYPTINADPAIVIHDPDHTRNTGDETADPLTLTTPLPNTLWHVKDPSKDVVFTEKSAVIAATIPLGTGTIVSTQSCSIAHANSFMAVGANAPATTTTITQPVSAAEATTTVAAAAAPATTLPRTGANIAFWLIVAAVCLDAGAVLLVGTKRRATQLLHHRRW